MSIDLRATLFPESEPQPDAVTEGLHRLSASVLASRDPSIWERIIPAYTEQARVWVRSGIVNGTNAASVIFISHALSAAHKVSGHHGAGLIFGFVIQLGMSEAALMKYQEAIASAGGLAVDRDETVMRLENFPETVVNYLLKKDELGILAELYRSARLSTDHVALAAMQEAKDFDTWIADLAMLAAYLAMRYWLPLANDEGDMPLLKDLFAESELQTFRRKEAFSAECFAHPFTSFLEEKITPEHQQAVAAEFERLDRVDHLGARQWLALGKSRFQIAPYIGLSSSQAVSL